MATQRTPARVRWAVERLQLAPHHDVLEIGCGNGAGLALVCDRLDGGSALGVDRSAVAIDLAKGRLATRLESGQVDLLLADLKTVDLPAAGFDAALAVNVNLFWTREPTAELGRLHAALRPGGALHLVWEPRDEAGVTRIATTVGAALDAAGFAVTIATATTRTGNGVVDVTGTVPEIAGRPRTHSA